MVDTHSQCQASLRNKMTWFVTEGFEMCRVLNIRVRLSRREMSGLIIRHEGFAIYRCETSVSDMFSCETSVCVKYGEEKAQEFPACYFPLFCLPCILSKICCLDIAYSRMVNTGIARK